MEDIKEKTADEKSTMTPITKIRTVDILRYMEFIQWYSGETKTIKIIS